MNWNAGRYSDFWTVEILGFWRFSNAGPRQDDKEMAMELCAMSVLEVEEFLDDKRTHMVEGIIVGQVSISFLFLNLSLLSGDLLIH